MLSVIFCFFLNHTATTEIYTLSLHDALPIFTDATSLGRTAEFEQRSRKTRPKSSRIASVGRPPKGLTQPVRAEDRKSTRLNSSHPSISYAVFCLKKKKKKYTNHIYYLFVQLI